MNDPLLGLAALSFAAWVYLAFLHGRFWRADQRLDEVEPLRPETPAQPAVTAVVPARNEADIIERSIGSLLDQKYSGELRVILVDDHSEDATGEVARRLAARHPHGDRLTVIRSEAMPPGWVGKMWAVHTGVSAAAQLSPDAEYLLLTDADVEHDSGNLARLVSKAKKSGLDLVSLMVLLHCKSAWERLLIPAFVYFFQKLYPFPRINDPRSRTTGAAGGCMLVRCDALKRAGGIESVRSEIIDDCALGAAIKRGGAVWVGVTDSEYSFRPYQGLRDIWAMVTRSAYTQLHYSVALLVGTVVGLVIIYLLPPLLLITWPLHGNAAAGLLGTATWTLMAWTFLPTLHLYRLNPFRALALPAAGALYLGMTVDSARLHWLGRGAHWKGRAGAGSMMARARRNEPAEPDLVVAAALRIEARALRRGAQSAEIVCTGMGAARARRAAGELRNRPGRALAVAGVSGALDSRLKPGDIIVVSALCEPKGGEPQWRELESAQKLLEILDRLGHRPSLGRLATVDHIVRGGERGELLETGARIVDMETAHLAHGAAGRRLGGLPFRVGDGSAAFQHVYVGNVAHAHVLALRQLLESAAGRRRAELFHHRRFAGRQFLRLHGSDHHWRWVIRCRPRSRSVPYPVMFALGAVVEAAAAFAPPASSLHPDDHAVECALRLPRPHLRWRQGPAGFRLCADLLRGRCDQAHDRVLPGALRSVRRATQRHRPSW